MKIAIISYKPLSSPASGYEVAILTMAKSLIKSKNKVEIFSIGKYRKSRSNYNVKEHIIKGYIYSESGFGLKRLWDFICLSILKYRPQIEKLNDNKEFLRTIQIYKPDIIIVSSIQIADLAEKCALTTGAKIVVYTDSYELINSSLNELEQLNLPQFIKKLIKRIIGKSYLNYMTSLYMKMIKIGDTIIFPTEKDRTAVVKKFKLSEAKTFVAPPVIIKTNETQNSKPANKIKTITFIGAANYAPNDKAVNIIKTRIAPKLKHINFLIVGKGQKSAKEGNVEIIGDAKDLSNILKRTDAFIAPITLGRGMKTKIATYLEAGKPIVGTSLAFEGYGIKDRINGIVEDNLNKIYKRIIELSNDPKLMRKIQQNEKLIIRNFSEKSLREKWLKIIESL
ncbi:MAG: glycosyltransferase family 4 protein [Candidatus Micrarchaeaceae archaeon]